MDNGGAGEKRGDDDDEGPTHWGSSCRAQPTTEFLSHDSAQHPPPRFQFPFRDSNYIKLNKVSLIQSARHPTPLKSSVRGSGPPSPYFDLIVGLEHKNPKIEKPNQFTSFVWFYGIKLDILVYIKRKQKIIGSNQFFKKKTNQNLTKLRVYPYK